MDDEIRQKIISVLSKYTDRPEEATEDIETAIHPHVVSVTVDQVYCAKIRCPGHIRQKVDGTIRYGCSLSPDKCPALHRNKKGE